MIQLFLLLLVSHCNKIREAKAYLLELNMNCFHELTNIDTKWLNYKQEISNIEWLCRINSQKYNIAVADFTELLSSDLLIASKKCLL